MTPTLRCYGSFIDGPTGIASRYIMAQDIVVDIKDYLIDESPLVVCKDCGKLVPKTNLCLYCGAPILYRQESQS